MDANRKNRILKSLNQMPLNDIWDLIKSNDFTLKEMEEAGIAPDLLYELKGKQKRADEDIIMQQKNAEAASKEKENQKLEAESKEAELSKICLAIEDGVHGAEYIQKKMKEYPNLEDYLIQNSVLTKELIGRIKNYSKVSTAFTSWEKTPPLESNRTDIFFFGQPGSGKSCVLASLFYYFEKTGIMMANMTNPIGVEYRNQLIDEISSGILPDGTEKDKLNFIPIELRNKTNRKITHPLNFIEMSGELFKEAARDGLGNQDLLKLKGYLNNGNRKLIFFVLDYHQHSNKIGGHNQSRFTDFLEWLDLNSILDKTDGIYILLTKADLFPKNEDPKIYASKFLDSEFLNFKENVQEKKAKYRDQFQIILFPYSIGTVKFKDILLTLDQEYPSFITDAIMKHSFVKKKSFFDKLFKN